MIPDATTIELSLKQVMYLSAFAWVQLDEDPADATARELFLQLRDAAGRLGVVWFYGEPPALPPEMEQQRRATERHPERPLREGRA